MRKLVYIFMILMVVILLYLPLIPKTMITYERLQEQVLPHITSIYTKQDALTLRKNYQLTKEMYTNCLYYVNEDAMDVDEIMIVEIEDETLRYQMLEKMQEHLKQQINIFQGYGEIQIEKLNKAIVGINGNCCIYIVCKESDEIEIEVES